MSQCYEEFDDFQELYNEFDDFQSLYKDIAPKCRKCRALLEKTDKFVRNSKYGEFIDLILWRCNSCHKLYTEDDLRDFYYWAYMQSQDEKYRGDYLSQFIDFDNLEELKEVINNGLSGYIIDDMQEQAYDFLLQSCELEIQYAIRTLLDGESYTINQYLLDTWDYDIERFVEGVNFHGIGGNAIFDEFSKNIYVLKLKENKRILPPIVWYGGKSNMVKDILKIIPQHNTFVEVFGGSGSVLLGKELSKFEIYNDINKDLFNLYNVIKSKDGVTELIRLLKLTPYHKSEFDKSKTIALEDERIEKARKFFVKSNMAINGNGGFSIDKKESMRGMSKAVAKFLARVNRLPEVSKRLEKVEIENEDFRKIIKKYDSKDTLFYLDPPYVKSTRVQKNSYKHEMDDEEHKELINILKYMKGKAILSGYDNEIYSELLKHGFKKKLLGIYDKGSSHGLKNESKKATEYVWINF